jgi:trehalose 6-phosphate phosphatase
MQDREIRCSSFGSRIAEFLEGLPRAGARALLLDYDGTLAPFTLDPASALPYPGVADALRRIQQETDTRLVIVTGRHASDIPRLMGWSGIEIWGCHGLERIKADGSSNITRIDARLLSAIETAHELIAWEGLSELEERKTASVAVHWRGREDLSEEIMRKMRHVWSMLPDRSALRFAPFDGGIEIRVAKIDKGDVVRTIFRELGADVAMAYLGDDVTDEDAFGALMRRGLSILIRDEVRPTLADAWIQPPQGLLAFLRSWTSACCSPSSSLKKANG